MNPVSGTSDEDSSTSTSTASIRHPQDQTTVISLITPSATQPSLPTMWYKDAVFYQLYTRTFFDSTSNGVGDFVGLAKKLDFLSWLGIDALWILPFYPSPLHDGGYDVADYCNIHSMYGNLETFKTFVSKAHARNIKITIDIPLNHTSWDHTWWKEAKKSVDNPYHDYYIFSKTNDIYKDASIIFCDIESSNWAWNEATQEYYWHRFYTNQPDLNYENPKVWDEIFKIFDFWIDIGIDGFRLDAVAYLYPEDGTKCVNLDATHKFIQTLRKRISKKAPNVFLVAEVNESPTETLKYFSSDVGNGLQKEAHQIFNFPMMLAIHQAHIRRNADSVRNLLNSKFTQDIPDDCSWGLFLRNHDELPCTALSEQEWGEFQAAYSPEKNMLFNIGIKRRLAPLLNNDIHRISMFHALLLSLKGSPYIYYGDEIGMGDDVTMDDRNGLRTPMQWHSNISKNAGFSSASSDQLTFPLITKHPFSPSDGINVEDQRANPSSLLNMMQNLIHSRKPFNKVIGRGSLTSIEARIASSVDSAILSFVRTYQNISILCVFSFHWRKWKHWAGITPFTNSASSIESLESLDVSIPDDPLPISFDLSSLAGNWKSSTLYVGNVVSIKSFDPKSQQLDLNISSSGWAWIKLV